MPCGSMRFRSKPVPLPLVTLEVGGADTDRAPLDLPVRTAGALEALPRFMPTSVRGRSATLTDVGVFGAVSFA